MPPTLIESDTTTDFLHLPLALAEECLDSLTDPAALNQEEIVHQLRVATKHLRAAWHLVKALAPADVSRRRREALRAFSAQLSASRDLAVLDALAQALAARQTDGQIALALDAVREQLHHAAAAAATTRSSPSEIFTLLREELNREIAAWRAVPRDHHSHRRRAIRHQLRKSRQRARRDARDAARSLDAELWHDWRKTVKRLRYQREFVALSQGRLPGRIDARISRLGTRLGERNDLANLAAFADRLLAEDRLDTRRHGLVRKAIAHQERQLIANCRRLGRQLFVQRG